MRAFKLFRFRAAALAALLSLACGAAAAQSGPTAPPAAPSGAAPGNDIEAQSRALTRASDAVVGVLAIAVDEALSNATLGRLRQGSGIVIGADDLVLTIGYLVLEADKVALVTDDRRVLPARVVAYDVATGFGLLQSLAPLRLEPVPLGDPATLAREEPLMVASGGQDGAVSIAQLVSRRPFAGYWEYAIDGALFTVPPRPDHSGAGLFNGRGELVGVGSLLLQDAGGADAPGVAGNMFVPVDLLRPILGELRARGRSSASERAWLGLNCVEHAGELRVLRVSRDSPADVAGVEPGDRIVRIDGTEVGALDALWKALWAGGRPEREVQLDILRGGQPQTLKLQSVDRMKTLKRPEGV